MVWGDEKFRQLSDDAKLIFFFVLTHPNMTCLGAMRGTVGGLADELAWKPARFQRALSQLTALGIVVHEAAAAFLWLPNFVRHNEPESPNSVKYAWARALELIPECQGKRDLVARCGAYLATKSSEFRRSLGDALRHTFPEAFPEGLQDAIGQPSDIQEQEPEQEQGLLHHIGAGAPLAAGTVKSSANGNAPWPSPEALVALYHEWAPPGHPRVTTLTPGRRKKASKYLRAFPEASFWRDAFAEIGRSALLQGRRRSPGHEHFVANFDWLLTTGKDGTENVAKVAEGKYRDRAQNDPEEED